MGVQMLGLMMQQPLLVSSLLLHAERHHASQEIVSRRVEGDIHHYTYGDLASRSRRMAKALTARGMAMGGTLFEVASPEDDIALGGCERHFLPASVLNGLRRDAVAALEAARPLRCRPKSSTTSAKVAGWSVASR